MGVKHGRGGVKCERGRGRVGVKYGRGGGW